jgi:dynein heavy chain
LIEDVTKAFYQAICRGLFEKDKLLYSFLNTSSIQRRSGAITGTEWNAFLRGSTTDFKDKENKAKDILADEKWQALWGLEECCPAFKDITASCADPADQPTWREYMASENPEKCNLPAIYEDRLNNF